MTKHILAIAILFIGAAFFLATPAHADIISSSTPSYDSPDSYDFNSSFPPTTYQSIGTFTFTPLTVATFIDGITVSGTFGNGDSSTTTLSDYFIGTAADPELIEVAACDNILANCYSGQEGPYAWTVTLTQTQIAELAPALAAGSVDFGYTWDASPPNQPISLGIFGYLPQYVYAGAATLDITTPEPGTLPLCLSGLIGLAAFWWLRKRRTAFKSPI